MSQLAVQVQSLSKQFTIGEAQPSYRTIRDTIARAVARPLKRSKQGQSRARKEREIIWALQDVSFELNQGSVLGVIGHNGAGKSTLLKILSRITEPTSGFAEIRGRVGSLLEVGTGFHFELTGRENIFLNGAILGMKHSEITRKLDEMVAFAEVERFLDTPLKHYSTGMHLRLAFAVAAHLEPEVLLVDEVLAVGDARFQKKCLGKMEEVAAAGRTLLFVSHNLAAVKELCSSCLVFQDGKLEFFGEVTDALGVYGRMMAGRSEETLSGSGWHGLRVVDENGEVSSAISGQESFTVEAGLALNAEISHGHVYCIVSAFENTFVHSRVDIRDVLPHAKIRRCQVQVSIPPLWLVPGAYTVRLKLVATSVEGQSTASTSEPLLLEVSGSAQGLSKALIAPDCNWVIRDSDRDHFRESRKLSDERKRPTDTPRARVQLAPEAGDDELTSAEV